MNETKSTSISSFAAPTAQDIAVLRSLTVEQRKELLAAELAKGAADIEAGRFTDLRTDREIAAFFEQRRASDEKY